MSRGQQNQVFSTASGQNAQSFQNAQNAFGQAQSGVQNYRNNLAKFVSGNPYVQGGEYDQTINAGLANASDAAANSLNGALEAEARRTGQNSAADAATASSMAQADERNLSSQLARAQQQRISDEAGYNEQALRASAVPEQMEAGLFGQAGGQANQQLGSEEQAARQPSFWDQVGNAFASGLGRGVAGGVAGGIGAAVGGGRGGR